MPAGSHDLHKSVCACLVLYMFDKHFTMKSVWKLRPQRLIIKNVLQGTKRKVDYGLCSDFQTIEALERNKDTNIGFQHVSRLKAGTATPQTQVLTLLLVRRPYACWEEGRRVGVTQPLHAGLKCPCQSFSVQWEAQETHKRDFPYEFPCPWLPKCTQ